jgi:ATP-dependent Clp protease ATP-binding subunit ClpA
MCEHLSDAIIIMTSNLGSEHFRKLTNPLGFFTQHTGVDQVKADVARELERRLSPEFRNRIDEVVLFTPLTTADVRAIAKAYLSELEPAFAKAGKTIEIEDDALELVVAEAYSQAFGARFLKRVIDERIKLPITMPWNDGSHFRVRRAGQGIALDVNAARLVAA